MNKGIDLILKGGGSKIAALVGAYAALEKYNYNAKRVAGTSAGSIVGGMVAAGFPAGEITKLVLKTDMAKIARDLNVPLIWNWNFRDKWGMFKGDRFTEWYGRVLAKKGITTFEGLEIELRVVATDLTNRKQVVFPETGIFRATGIDGTKYQSEIINHEFSIARAVRMSMSIPYVFTPVKYNGNIIVDGFILNNLPITIFDDHPRQTIAIQLLGEKDTKPNKITNGCEFGVAIMDTMFATMEREHIEEASWANVIQVNTGDISGTDFGISRKDKEWLWQQGYDAVDGWVKNNEGGE